MHRQAPPPRSGGGPPPPQFGHRGGPPPQGEGPPPHHRRGPRPPGYRGGDRYFGRAAGPPPPHRGGPPPPGWRPAGLPPQDRYRPAKYNNFGRPPPPHWNGNRGRGRSLSRSRSRSRSDSRSYSRSPSRSSRSSSRSYSRSSSRGRSGSRSMSRSNSRSASPSPRPRDPPHDGVKPRRSRSGSASSHASSVANKRDADAKMTSDAERYDGVPKGTEHHSRSRSRSHTSSHVSKSRSRSRSHNRASSSRRSGGGRRYSRRSRSRHHRSLAGPHIRSSGRRSSSKSPPSSRRRRSYSSSSYSSASSSGASSCGSSVASYQSDAGSRKQTKVESAFSKDQRTVLVTQLVMRARDKDLKRYFHKMGCRVNEVILLRDKRTNQHKGLAYVEMSQMEDVQRALALSGQAPTFQRFSLLIKASEAEKNHVPHGVSSPPAPPVPPTPEKRTPLMTKDGKIVESQQVYVGSLDHYVKEEHLYAIFSQFGSLEKVVLQIDPSTRRSKGFAFLSFFDPKDAFLAIQTMANQILASRPMKTGWASQTTSMPGVEICTSEEFPADATVRAQKAMVVLQQLGGSVVNTSAAAAASFTPPKRHAQADTAMALQRAMMPGTSNHADIVTALVNGAVKSSIPTVAEARASMMAAAAAASQTARIPPPPPPSKVELISGTPSSLIMVFNMYNKDEETQPGWEQELKEEFEDEAGKFGKLIKSAVLSNEVGGKICAQYETKDQAAICASKLAGRWFDKRQLRVQYLKEDELPASMK